MGGRVDACHRGPGADGGGGSAVAAARLRHLGRRCAEGALAAELRTPCRWICANRRRAHHNRMLLVHETDDARGGVGAFSHFFGSGQTPSELLHLGIYKEVAVPMKAEPYRRVSPAPCRRVRAGKRSGGCSGLGSSCLRVMRSKPLQCEVQRLAEKHHTSRRETRRSAISISVCAVG